MTFSLYSVCILDSFVISVVAIRLLFQICIIVYLVSLWYVSWALSMLKFFLDENFLCVLVFGNRIENGGSGFFLSLGLKHFFLWFPSPSVLLKKLWTCLVVTKIYCIFHYFSVAVFSTSFSLQVSWLCFSCNKLIQLFLFWILVDSSYCFGYQLQPKFLLFC